MSETNGDFVTIAEAARRLGIAPRQVRRYAERLGTEDRDTGDTEGTGTGDTEGQSPLRVRYSAIVALRARGNGQGHTKDGPGDRDRGQPGTVPPGVPGEDPRLLREIIERQDRQIGDLNTALERSQSLQMAQLTETRELRRRLGELEEENRALRMIEAPKRGDREDTEAAMPTPNDPNDDTTGPKGEESQSAPHEGVHHDAHTQIGRQFVAESEQESGGAGDTQTGEIAPAHPFHPTAEAEPFSVEESQPGFQGFSPVRDGERNDRETPQRPWWRFWR